MRDIMNNVLNTELTQEIIQRLNNELQETECLLETVTKHVFTFSEQREILRDRLRGLIQLRDFLIETTSK